MEMAPSIQADRLHRFSSFQDGDEKAVETDSLLYKVSMNTNITSNQQRRRRVGSGKAPPPSSPRRQQSLSRDIGHAAAETYLITWLSFKLLRYLGLGYRWITRFIALACYAMLLMPGFLQVAYYYYFSSQVRRSIVYGDQPRNRLDLYLPTNSNGPKPVVAFILEEHGLLGTKHGVLF
ncbi:hypothetical protein L1049_003114 [Liquidambar formosana]|uniref:Uncharacterized protein n=1 Tax=Liquidambar formosana TaxID=63359 RepID=A0AAP0NIZ9_LIQFO